MSVKHKTSPMEHNILICRAIELHKNIWEECNIFVNGKNIQETHQKLRQRTLEQVRTIYLNNPTLASCFTVIKAISLEQWLRRTTKNLHEWITRIEHQKAMNTYMEPTMSASQMMIHEAFWRAKDRQGFINKYPP